MAGTCGEDERGKGGKEVISEHARREYEFRKTKVKVDGQREGGPEEDGVTIWRIRAHRRDDWKMVVKEAKVLQGL